MTREKLRSPGMTREKLCSLGMTKEKNSNFKYFFKILNSKLKIKQLCITF